MGASVRPAKAGDIAASLVALHDGRRQGGFTEYTSGNKDGRVQVATEAVSRSATDAGAENTPIDNTRFFTAVQRDIQKRTGRKTSGPDHGAGGRLPDASLRGRAARAA